MLENKIPYKHDFDGSCAPNAKNYFGNRTFSVGIFQWIPKSSGSGMKRSAVKYRIKGYSSNAKNVYARARTVCLLLDTGFKMDAKSETVRD